VQGQAPQATACYLWQEGPHSLTNTRILEKKQTMANMELNSEPPKPRGLHRACFEPNYTSFLTE
jgi:hypothetical protein